MKLTGHVARVQRHENANIFAGKSQGKILFGRSSHRCEAYI